MSYAEDVIHRCTRDGVILWGHVAKQLGMSVDKARRLYDLTSASRHDPQMLSEPEPLTDAQAYKSPHPKGPGMKAKILTLIARHGALSVEDMANRLHSTPDSIRRRLCVMVANGLITGSKVSPTAVERTWRLTDAGKMASQIGPGAKSDIGKAA